MILVDANLLIYAVNKDASHHKKACSWLEKTLSKTTDVGLAWIVILAFLRITTHPRIMRNPLDTDSALGYIAEWLDQPYVTLVTPGEHHWPIFMNLVRTTGTAANLTSDAHIAALAIEYGCEICSADYDFQRFPSVRHVNPLKDA